MMKTQFFGFLSFAFCSAAFSQPVTNEVLFVDQHGNVSRPESLATVAQMAANEAAILTAEQKAEAAAAAAKEGTNLVQDVIRDITANELTVYRYGYTDAFGVVVILDADAKLVITDFKPLDATDSAGRQMFSLTYALQNSQSVAVKPDVRWSAQCVSRENFESLPAEQVGEPVAGGEYVDPSGVVYQYTYSITFSAPTTDSGFFVVNLSADDASGDGWTFDIPNGVTGGVSGDYVFGTNTLTFTGGILTGVK